MIKRASPQKAPSKRRLPWVVLGVVVTLVAFALFWQETSRSAVAPDEPLRIWFFDVGQGESALIETPGGKQVLVDGGPHGRVMSKLGSVMMPWDRTIDAVVLSHPHADHVGGLIPVFEHYEIKQFYESGAEHETRIVRTFETVLEKEGARHGLLARGDVFLLDGVRFDVLGPEKTLDGFRPADPNKASVVLRVTYGETTVLFPGDASVEEERVFTRSSGDIDVFKVGHSGSVTSTSDVLLRRTDPEVAVISVGAENSYGHPHASVLHRLQEYGLRVLRTDRDGDILLTSEGGEPTVRPAPLPF